ncbi:hypothetical protein PHLCEN_2v11147, partial [Hermanssonia centrifuga]
PFLVVFCILLIMMLWAYVMVITTSPGKAGQHVEPSEAPAYDNPVPRWWDAEDEIGGGPYQYAPQGTNQNGGSSGLPTKPSPARLAEKGSQQDYNAGDTDAIPPVAAARTRAEVNGNEAANVPPNQTNGNQNTSGQLPMMFSRSPPQTPVLRPEFRYCQRDGFIKPLRAHHCRACGTCILKYDHHCPWIGQCVGAHNHKFFVHFCQWAAIFCMWTFSTLVAGTVKMSKNGGAVDAQTIVIIALSALFILFTTVLLITHIRLIILNQSTVDSLKAQHMKEREKSVLARMHSWYQFGGRRSNGIKNGVISIRKETSGGWEARGKTGKLSWDLAYGDGFYRSDTPRRMVLIGLSILALTPKVDGGHGKNGLRNCGDMTLAMYQVSKRIGPPLPRLTLFADLPFLADNMHYHTL